MKPWEQFQQQDQEDGLKPWESFKKPSKTHKKKQEPTLFQNIKYGLQQGLSDLQEQIQAAQQVEREQLNPFGANSILQQKLKEAGFSQDEQGFAQGPTREQFAEDIYALTGGQAPEPQGILGNIISGASRGATGAIAAPGAPGTGAVANVVGNALVGAADESLAQAGVENPLIRLLLLMGSAKGTQLASKIKSEGAMPFKQKAVEKYFGIKPEQVNARAFTELEKSGVKAKPISSFIDNENLKAFETDLIASPKHRPYYQKSFEQLTNSINDKFDDIILGVENAGIKEPKFSNVKTPASATQELQYELGELKSWENKAWEKSREALPKGTTLKPEDGERVLSALDREIGKLKMGGITEYERPTLNYYESLKRELTQGTDATRSRIRDLNKAIEKARAENFPENSLEPLKNELKELQRQIPAEQLVEANKKLNSVINYDEVTTGSDASKMGLKQVIKKSLEDIGDRFPEFGKAYPEANAITSDLKRSIRSEVIEAAIKNGESERLSNMLNSERGIRKFDEAMNYSDTTRELGNKFKAFKAAEMIENRLFSKDRTQLKKGSQNFLEMKPGNKRILENLIGKDAYNRLQEMQYLMERVKEPLNAYVNSSGTAAALQREGFTPRLVATAALIMKGQLALALTPYAGSARKYILSKLIQDPKIQRSIALAQKKPTPTNIKRAEILILNMLRKTDDSTIDQNNQ